MPRLRRRDRDLPFVMLVPSVVTIIGLVAGLSSIRFTLEGAYQIAAALIVFAAVIDGLDGLIARRLRAVTRFGAELDSLSDFLCFGVAPGVLVYAFALTGEPGAGWTAVLIFAIACCLRLARFNLNRDAPPPPGKPRFVGVPAPAGAMLALLPLFASFAGLVDMTGLPWVVAPYLALVGVLMVSRVPTLSPKGLRFSRERALWLLIGTALLAGLMFTRFWLLLVILVLLYMATLIGVALSARRESRRAVRDGGDAKESQDAQSGDDGQGANPVNLKPKQED